MTFVYTANRVETDVHKKCKRKKTHDGNPRTLCHNQTTYALNIYTFKQQVAKLHSITIISTADPHIIIVIIIIIIIIFFNIKKICKKNR